MLLQLYDQYKISRNIVIRQEIFGGLVFDRLNFVIYKLTPQAYFLLSSFYNSAHDFSKISGLLDIRDNEITSFINLALHLKFLVEKNLNEDVVPSAKYEYTHAIELDENDIARCRATETLITTLRAPTFVWWDITYLCNFSCTYCYSNSGTKTDSELELADVRKILKSLREAGVFYVFFLGGEPLMRKDFFSILEYAQEIGLSTMLTSNGWFIDEGISKKLYSSGVSIARVSIDGHSSHTHDKIRNKEGSWERATEAAKLLVRAQIPRVGISPTVTAENIDEIGDLIAWANDNKVNEIQISPLCATGRGSQLSELSIEQSLKLKKIVSLSKERYNIMINAPEGIDDNKPEQNFVKNGCQSPLLLGCGAGRNSIALSPSGEVYPCILKRQFVGYILDYEKLSDFLQSNGILELRTKRDLCLGCKFEDYCAGLCRIMSARDSLDCKLIEN